MSPPKTVYDPKSSIDDLLADIPDLSPSGRAHAHADLDPQSQPLLQPGATSPEPLQIPSAGRSHVGSSFADLHAEVTADLPARAADRQPAVGQPVHASGGKPGRTTISGTFIPTNTIVENVRLLLMDSYTTGDIKRMLVSQFGGKGASFNKHIALARRRNNGFLQRTPEESRSDAMMQWQRLLVEAKKEKARAEQNLKNAQKDLDDIRKVSGKLDPDEDADAWLSAMSLIDSKERNLQACEKVFASARHHVDKYQNTIDRMLGNNAPNKTENVTTISGTLTHETAPKEPMTREDNDAQLRDILQQMRTSLQPRITSDAPAEGIIIDAESTPVPEPVPAPGQPEMQ
jgi:hypothetical protein